MRLFLFATLNPTAGVDLHLPFFGPQVPRFNNCSVGRPQLGDEKTIAVDSQQGMLATGLSGFQA